MHVYKSLSLSGAKLNGCVCLCISIHRYCGVCLCVFSRVCVCVFVCVYVCVSIYASTSLNSAKVEQMLMGAKVHVCLYVYTCFYVFRFVEADKSK